MQYLLALIYPTRGERAPSPSLPKDQMRVCLVAFLAPVTSHKCLVAQWLSEVHPRRPGMFYSLLSRMCLTTSNVSLISAPLAWSHRARMQRGILFSFAGIPESGSIMAAMTDWRRAGKPVPRHASTILSTLLRLVRVCNSKTNSGQPPSTRGRSDCSPQLGRV